LCEKGTGAGVEKEGGRERRGPSVYLQILLRMTYAMPEIHASTIDNFVTVI